MFHRVHGERTNRAWLSRCGSGCLTLHQWAELGFVLFYTVPGVLHTVLLERFAAAMLRQ